MMHRRSFLALCGTSGASLVLPKVAFSQDHGRITGTGEVVVAALGGTLQDNQRDAYFQPFQEKSGITVRLVSYSNLSEALAQHRTGNVEWDIVYVSGGGVIALSREGALANIDYSVLDPAELEGIPESLRLQYGAPDAAFTRTIAYNTSAFPNGNYPKSWTDFWDTEKFPGPRSLGGFSGTLSPDLEFAPIADSVPMDQLYPLDVDRAFASLEKIKPQIRTFWTTGAMAPQMLTDGEVVIASAYATRIHDLAATGAPVGFDWNQGMIYMGYWSIMNGAKNYDNAMKCIAYITSARAQADFVTLNPMGPANAKAFEHLPEELHASLPTSPRNADKLFIYNDEWWADNRQAIQERWDAWVLQ